MGWTLGTDPISLRPSFNFDVSDDDADDDADDAGDQTRWDDIIQSSIMVAPKEWDTYAAEIYLKDLSHSSRAPYLSLRLSCFIFLIDLFFFF